MNYYADPEPLFDPTLSAKDTDSDLSAFAIKCSNISARRTIRMLRERGLTTRNIMEEFSCSESMVSYMSKGARAFNPAYLEYTCCTLLHISANDLVLGDRKGVALTGIPNAMMNVLAKMSAPERGAITRSKCKKYERYCLPYGNERGTQAQLLELVKERLTELAEDRACDPSRIMYASNSTYVTSEPYRYSVFQQTTVRSINRFLNAPPSKCKMYTLISIAIMLEVPIDYLIIRDYARTADWIEYYEQVEGGPPVRKRVNNLHMYRLLSVWLRLPHPYQEAFAAEIIFAPVADPKNTIVRKRKPEVIGRLPEKPPELDGPA